ncbi:hypothetical protein MTR_3g060230 [Medicago truncatula]|uniref:Uncharacterized protein n=1 Tax=Medicago truncatula TaxID=3880 RepID=G7IV13_MEDTR|nr:hypothetical protein MTR_3g060230 [Medicago truncatula]
MQRKRTEQRKERQRHKQLSWFLPQHGSSPVPLALPRRFHYNHKDYKCSILSKYETSQKCSSTHARVFQCSSTKQETSNAQALELPEIPSVVSIQGSSRRRKTFRWLKRLKCVLVELPKIPSVVGSKNLQKAEGFPMVEEFWPVFNNAWGAQALLGEHGHALGALTMLRAAVSAFRCINPCFFVLLVVCFRIRCLGTREQNFSLLMSYEAT